MESVFSGATGVWIFALYGLLILGIGIFVYLSNRTMHKELSSYYLGGRSFGSLILFFTFFATQYSGNTLIGFAPKAYRLGYPWIQSIGFLLSVPLVLLLFVAPLYKLSKKHKFITPGDWVEHRFKHAPLTLTITILMLYTVAIYLLAQLMAIGHAVSGVTGDTVSYQMAMVFFVAIMLIYGWLGGMRSVAYTDLLQGFMLALGVTALMIGCFNSFGSLGEAAQYMLQNKMDKIILPSEAHMFDWFGVLIIFGLAVPFYPQLIQRVYAARDENVLKRTLIGISWMPFLTVGGMLVVGLIGIMAFPDLGLLGKIETEKLVGMMSGVIASQGKLFYFLMILLIGGIISAILSTADSALLSFSSMISKDIYPKFAKKSSEHNKVLAGKIAGLVLTAVLMIIAWNPQLTLFQLEIFKFGLLVQVAPTFLLGMHFKNVRANTLFQGLLIGAGFVIAVAFLNMKSVLCFNSSLIGFALNGAYVIIKSLIENWEHIKDKVCFCLLRMTGSLLKFLFVHRALTVPFMLYFLTIPFYMGKDSHLPIILGFPFWALVSLTMHVLLSIAITYYVVRRM